MKPNEAARAIEEELHAVSGKPVLVHKDATVFGYATIKIASDDSPAHLLRYKPEMEAHLCSIMYAAFEQFAPNEDVGIDFSKEYEAANATRASSRS